MATLHGSGSNELIIILDGVHKTTRKPHELALGAQSRVHQSFIHVSRVN